MRLLLDTNVLIRMLEAPDLLGAQVQQALDDLDNEINVTTISLVEIAIKVGTGKLAMPNAIEARLHALGCEMLPVQAAHAMRMSKLPILHKDPFDRLIVAQALSEDMVLVTSDRQLAAYGVVTLQA